MSVGALIRERRKSKGLRQSDLAEAAGLSLNSVSRIELGIHQPNSHSIEMIANALGCPVSELFPPPKPAPATIEEALFRGGERELLLTLASPALRDLFRTHDGGTVDYDEAYRLATKAIRSKRVLDGVLRAYRDDQNIRNMIETGRQRVMLVLLEYSAIAIEEMHRQKNAGNREREREIYHEEYYEIRAYLVHL